MDTYEVQWSDPANEKAVGEHEIEQAKKLLRGNGYMVVERERVRYMTAQSVVNTLRTDCMSPENRKDYMAYVYRRLFHEFAPMLEQVYIEHVRTRFDRWSESMKHTAEIAVILPKQ